MNRYEKYKDSGVQWIGEIPSHWECVKPQHLFTPVQREPQDDDEIITCFRDGVVTLRKNRREEGFTTSLKEIGYQRVMVGDLVVHEMDGFEGSIGISDSTGKSTPVYTVIPPSPNYYNPYWMYLLREMANTRFIQCLSKSIRERTTEFRWLMWKGQLFPLPPLTEQHQIVSFLDEKTSLIDDLITKKEQKIGLLKEYRTSLINRVITKGLNPDCPMKDSGVEWIGMIPSHWEVKRNKYFTSPYDIRTLDGSGLLLSVSEHKGIIPRREVKEEGELTRAETLEGYKCVKPNHLVSNIMLMWKRGLGVSSYEGIVSPAYSVFEFVEGLPRYYHYLFRTDLYTSEFRRNSTGVIESRLRLYDDKFGSIHSHVPPISEQEQIVSFLDEKTGEIDRTIQSEQKKIELLKEYRQSLISSVITGKIKVVN